MIKLFKEEENKLLSIEEQDGIFEKIEKNMWIHMTEPAVHEIEKISKITKIDRDLLVSVTDEEESAHLDVDDDYTLIVLDIPVYVDDIYETYPFIIIYNKNFFSTCGNGRLHSWCNDCLSKRYNKNINNETDDVETDDVETDDVKTKKCTKCGEIKKMTDFYKDKTSPSGRLAYCKKCRNKQIEDYKIRKMKERGW